MAVENAARQTDQQFSPSLMVRLSGKHDSTGVEGVELKVQKMNRIVVALLWHLLFVPVVCGQSSEYSLEENVPYRSGDELTDYMRERCRLDVYYPRNKTQFSTVVWFHGGGISAGEKSIPPGLKEKGIAVVAVNYRLSPHVRAPAYLEDAAAAVAWTFRNIERFGGSRARIFVSGHSAGGYLTSMIGLDKSWLQAEGVDADDIAGLIPYSGHTITHFTIRSEMGLSRTQPLVDRYAPLFHVRDDAPPLLLITGDRDMEMLGRYEENAYLWRMMKEAGHAKTELFELEGYDHGGMAEPSHPLLLKFIRQHASR